MARVRRRDPRVQPGSTRVVYQTQAMRSCVQGVVLDPGALLQLHRARRACLEHFQRLLAQRMRLCVKVAMLDPGHRMGPFCAQSVQLVRIQSARHVSIATLAHGRLYLQLHCYRSACDAQQENIQVFPVQHRPRHVSFATQEHGRRFLEPHLPLNASSAIVERIPL